MDSYRQSLIIGYSDICDSWNLVEPILNLNFPLKINSDLFPNLKYYQPKFTPIDYLNYSPNEQCIDQPFLYLLLISLSELKSYKSNIRPLIQSWIDKLSFIEHGRILLIYSQSKIDSSSFKIIDKVRHDISTVYHNKCQLYLLESNTLKLTNKFADLVIACLVERRKKLEDLYENIWNSLANNEDSGPNYTQIFTESENLASFYIQTSEYSEALKIYRRLFLSHKDGFGSMFTSLFPIKSHPDDFNQPAIIFSDNVYEHVDEVLKGPRSFLYFSQYCLGMALLLHRLVDSSIVQYINDCLDFITYTRRLIANEAINTSQKWLINTILEIADNCNSLVSELDEDSIESDGKKIFLPEHKALGMLYTHAYFISKFESDKPNIKLLEDAIRHFTLGGYTRFPKALSLIDCKDSDSNLWLNIWDFTYPPFISLECKDSEISNDSLVFNVFTNSEVILTFCCPLDIKSNITLPVQVVFAMVIGDGKFVLSNTLTSIGESNKFKLEPIVLPEGDWLLESITHDDRILYPRDVTLMDSNLDKFIKCIIKVKCSLSLSAYSDGSQSHCDGSQSHWVCGYNNYIEFASVVDSFEVIFPIPVKLISDSVKYDSESQNYKFDAGKYKFLVYFNTIEQVIGKIIMKSTSDCTMIECEVTISPLFEINVRNISKVLSQLEITSILPIGVQLEVDEGDSKKVKEFPTLIPNVPFYILLDVLPNNKRLVITWEKMTFTVDLSEVLAKKSDTVDKFDIDITASNSICTGEPFTVNIYGSKKESIACEFENSDSFILCGWNRKVFLDDKSDFMELQVHFIPLDIDGHNEFPPLRVTSYPSNQLIETVYKDVYVSPSKIATFEITEL